MRFAFSIFFSLLAVNANAAVLANVGSKEITSDQIKMEYQGMNGDQRKAINDDAMTRKGIVDNMINAELLVQAASTGGLDKDEDYKAAMEKFRRQYLATRYMQQAIEPKLGKSDIKKFFESNKALFDSTEVCAEHIVVQDEKEAVRITSLAKAKGANFAELAKKYSIDPTVQENKGNLGCFTRERMVPEFSVAAFSMHKNEVRGPVRTMYGFHIIRVTDIKAGKVPNYEEVEQRVKETYRVRLMQEMIADLRAKANVKVNDEEVRKFKL